MIFLIFDIIVRSRRMGCEESMLEKIPPISRVESSVSEEDNRL
jgi:hypothetical protein